MGTERFEAGEDTPPPVVPTLIVSAGGGVGIVVAEPRELGDSVGAGGGRVLPGTQQNQFLHIISSQHSKLGVRHTECIHT